MEETISVKKQLINKICPCRNSIKQRIIEYINNNEQPYIICKLIDKLYDCISKENAHLIIEENFLKTYIRSIISEMVEEKLIKMHKFTKNEIEANINNNQLLLIQLNTNILSEFVNKTVNTDFNINTNAANSTRESIEQVNKSNAESLKPEDIKNAFIDEIIILKKKLDQIKKDNKNTILHNEIHRFNELKDLGQELLGYISVNKGNSVKELYDELGISDDDR